jgi:hypothetical protein
LNVRHWTSRGKRRLARQEQNACPLVIIKTNQVHTYMLSNVMINLPPDMRVRTMAGGGRRARSPNLADGKLHKRRNRVRGRCTGTWEQDAGTQDMQDSSTGCDLRLLVHFINSDVGACSNLRASHIMQRDIRLTLQHGLRDRCLRAGSMAR